MDQPYQYHGVTLYRPEEDSVGILLSGGLDSALLLYMLMDSIGDKTIEIYTLGQEKYNNQEEVYSKKVIEYCSAKTGFTNYNHHVSYTRDRHQLYQLSQTIPSKFYFAITANPPGWLSEDRDRDRTWGVGRPIVNGNSFHPFTNLHKKEMATISNELGITEDLLAITMSCVSEARITMDYHCGECWWCKEREWGYGKA